MLKMESCADLASAFNFCMILSCAVVLLYQGGQCVDRYLTGDTKVTTSARSTSGMTFPAFTICPEYHTAYNKTELSKVGLDNSKAYKNGHFYGNQTTDRDAFEIFDDVALILEEIVKEVIIYTTGAGYIIIGVSNSSEARWITKYDNIFGKCYSLELLPAITNLGIVNVRVMAHMSIYLYIHHPGQYMDVDTTTKVYANIGKLVFIDLVHEISENTLEAEGEVPCNRKMDFGYDKCGSAVVADTLAREFGCIVPWVPRPNKESIKICRFDFDTEAGSEFKDKVLKRYNFLGNVGTRKKCNSPCTVIETFLGLPFLDEGKPGEAFIKMYFKSMVKYKKAMLDYTWLSMLAEIGGYTGLLLGVSIVDVAGVIKKSIKKFSGE